MEQSVTVPIKQLAARLMISELQCPAAPLVLKSVHVWKSVQAEPTAGSIQLRSPQRWNFSQSQLHAWENAPNETESSSRR
eukprot:284877-Amphidinium_carterae.1